MNTIWIDTTRYSKVVRAFLDRYPSAVARLNKRSADGPPTEWCTNRVLKPLRDFSLSAGDRVVLSFHDTPRDLWAPEDQLDLVQQLEGQKICRFKLLKEKD